MGDFAHRRMPEHFLATWDPWLQAGLHGLRSRHCDWIDQYLQGPLWFFSLGPGVVGQLPWVGIMMPSVDGAGRYFPLTVATQLDRATTLLCGAPASLCLRLWTLSAQAAVEGLDQDMDATRFDATLENRFKMIVSTSAQDVVQLPEINQSSWFQTPLQSRAGDFLTAGLPRGTAFDALFGFVPGGSLESGEATP
jgi:type VI secretion system protein ImpM